MHRRIWKSIAATLAASMLACGIYADAFAEPVVSADEEYTPTGSSAEVGAGSDIAMYSSAAQLRFSVPTNIALALTYEGGHFSAPAPRTQEEASVSAGTDGGDGASATQRKARTGYGIENLSEFDIYVKRFEGSTIFSDPITGEPMPSGFTIGEKGWVWGEDGNRVFENTTRDGYVSELYVELRHPGFDPDDALSVEVILRDDGKAGQQITYENDNAFRRRWSIGPATHGADGVVVPTVFGIELYGFSSVCTTEIPADAVKAQRAFTIKYTIAPL